MSKKGRGKREKVHCHGMGKSSMHKQRTFADKVSSKTHEMLCPKCGEKIKTVLFVRPRGKGNKSKKSFVKVCKCENIIDKEG